MRLNKVQRAAYELIQADARFLYTLVDMSQNASNISSNYIMMCQPHIGIFADGAEQWCKKLGLKAPLFNEQEKNYYDALRQSHKLLEKTYSEYANLLMSKLAESDQYFYSIRSLREKVFGYYNVGTDLFNGEYCGNTILGAAYIPMPLLSNQNVSIMIKDLSVIVGELAGFFGCKAFAPYLYDDKGNTVECKDFHFFNNCPLKEKNELGVVLFSILCKMLIDLTQHATRCSNSSGQAQEYLIARHAAVETETVLVQICLELGAPSVICSLKECFQITDCLVYPMQIICFVFLCVQFHTFQIQVAFVTVAFYLRFRHKILVDDFLQSLSLYVIYYLHPGKQWCTVCCFGYGHHNLGLIRTTTSFAVMGRSANIAVIQLYNAGKQVFFVSLTHSGTNSIQ